MWEEWYTKFLSVASSKRVDVYILPNNNKKFFPVLTMEDWKTSKSKSTKKFTKEHEVEWYVNIKAMHFLTLGTSSIPFSMVKATSMEDLPRGDVRSAWKML